MTIQKEAFQKDMDALIQCGTRLTGSPGQLAFIRYIKDRLTEMGIPYETDEFRFDRWTPKEWSLSISEDGKDVDIPIASVHPYSGETPAGGLTEELYYVKSSLTNLAGARGKIAVFNYSKLPNIPGVKLHPRSVWPLDTTMPNYAEGITATTFIKCYYGYLARLAGAKAVVLVWKGFSDGVVQGQWTPFIMGFQKIPIVFINETNGKKVLAAAKAGKKAHFLLTAETEKDAFTETVYCTLKGKNEKEALIVNTHTDGPNAVEENGAPAILQMIEQLKDKELNRSIIFVFTTGHFRLNKFMDIRGFGFQSISRWMAMHRDLWNGKKGNIKGVAALTLEHLGCDEWTDKDGVYQYVNDICPEMVYTGNKVLDDLYINEVKNRTLTRSVTLKGHIVIHFGEGENLFLNGIPDIALCTFPDYLCTESESLEVEKFNLDLAVEQTQTFLNLAEKLDNMTAEEIGPSDWLLTKLAMLIN